MSCLQRLNKRAEECFHVDDFVIRADVALDQAVSNLLRFPRGHRGTPSSEFPRNGRGHHSKMARRGGNQTESEACGGAGP